ncbi:MAG: ATP-binding protein [Pseudomonadota bacterium]
MPDPIKTYQAIVAREKASREAAERLLEEKSRELFRKNGELARFAEQLREAHGLLSEMMSVAPNGILLCSEDLLITKANANGAKLLGCQLDAIAGRSLTEFTPELAITLDLADDGEFSVDCCDARTAAGTPIQIEVHGYCGKIRDRRRFMLLIRDITARLEKERHQQLIEKQLQEARRLEAIGTLSAGIAHEINTPIQYVSDNIEFLRDAIEQIVGSYRAQDALPEAECRNDGPLEAVATEASEAVTSDLADLADDIDAALSESRDGIRQVRDIVLLMKDFCHPGGAQEPCNLNDLVRNVVTLSKGRQKEVVAIEFEPGDDLPELCCRRSSVQQVIMNLVLNALDAVETVDLARRRISVRTSHDQQMVRVAVSDTGPGVPAELREKIFDPFFTTKPVGKGTGQGLAIAIEFIVKGHGGHLRLIEEPGFTTTFLIELPRHLADTPQTQEIRNVRTH